MLGHQIKELYIVTEVTADDEEVDENKNTLNIIKYKQTFFK